MYMHEQLATHDHQTCICVKHEIMIRELQLHAALEGLISRDSRHEYKSTNSRVIMMSGVRVPVGHGSDAT